MTSRPSDEWLTPPEIIAALGPFDLDPCSPMQRPWDTAARHFNAADNGLLQDWREDRAFVNPPYSDVSPWLGRLSAHGIGTALVFSKTETEWFFAYVWPRASALLFVEGRIKFHLPTGIKALKDAGSPSVLIAYGLKDADRLADSKIAGAFVPLACTGQIVGVFRHHADLTWDQLIARVARRQGGRITVRTACILVATHPKAARNRHLDAKVRQVCQGPAFKRVARGLFELKDAA